MRQSSCDKIDALVDQHRNGLAVLKKVADACLKEGESWQNNLMALHKARLQEEAACKKAKEKELKAEEKEAEKVRKAKEKEQEKLQKEAEQKDKEPTKELDEDRKKHRRRRIGGQEELSEADPLVLREMPNFSSGSMAFVESVSEFAQAIASSPDLPVACRLKKASLKKAMTVFRLTLLANSDSDQVFSVALLIS